ncbi:MAG: translation initiation factor IF-2 [Eubacteriaceae bacterium]|nr:translation initiation factor IF-2 [Eubacteriaceae bacterium]MDD4508202.1 translation initiation factor IF-2 [Eubacteriaceae bacterium]
MAKLRVYQLASQFKIPSKEFVSILNEYGIPVKNHMSALTDQQVKDFKEKFDPEKKDHDKEKKEKEKENTRHSSSSKKTKEPDKISKNSEYKDKTKKNPSLQGRGKSDIKKEKISKSSSNHKKEIRRESRPDHPVKKTNKMNDHEKLQSDDHNKRSKHVKKEEKKNTIDLDHKKQSKQRKHHNQDFHKNKDHNKKSVKIKDHSKKEKTARSVYKKIKAETKSEKMKNQVYEVPEALTVSEFAEILGCNATEIIKTLMMAGTMATINQQIDFDTASLVADEMGYEIKAIKMEDVVTKILEEYDEEETGNEVIRPPVVTVMGHVDHGKTSLLDRIRKAHVTEGEAGGITQHIGAYTVKINGQSITFIDTPGHEAFTAMRSRGAQMTDIAVLVVAADDGVMPQTIEAINHAKAAQVPIIVAINKIDKEGANPDRVKQELTEHNVIVEEWGGDVIAVPVSAKKGTNIDELLENILLVAEVEELKADPKRPGRGCVIEARVKKGKGSTASLLVQQGTLHVGDSIISGVTYGKVRTMVDDKGHRIRKAGPSKPVEISGLSDIPVAGDDFIVLPSDKEARQLAEKRQQMEKDARQAKSRISLDDLFTKIQEGQIQDINIIIKADVQGSVEAISQSLLKLNTEDVRINVIHGAVGAINETDVMLASTSDAIIIGFNVRPDKNALAAAETEKVDVRLYRVIYDAIEDVKKAMEGLLQPEFVEQVNGNADVRDTFRIPGGTIIAGAYVTDGKIVRTDEVRIIRDGIVVFEGHIASLRRFKDDVKEVNSGFECGIGIENYNDIKEGDIIETFIMKPIAREL